MFERLGSETVWEGQIAQVRLERWREADGEVVEREVMGHPGAVGILAYDDERVWLVRQPREAVGDPALLEIPAGKLDDDSETPEQTARRELAEEVGLAADDWRPLKRFHTSPGFTDEEVHLFAATGLREQHAEAEENERIEIVPWPLERLQDAIDECRDSKSLIALMALQQELRTED